MKFKRALSGGFISENGKVIIKREGSNYVMLTPDNGRKYEFNTLRGKLPRVLKKRS